MLRKLVKTVAFAVAVMGVATTFAVAAEMTCSAADDKGCRMAKGADGKEIKVSGRGVKAGDKIDCVAQDGKTECTKK